MKTTVSESEANRIPIDAVSIALQKLPYNGQDETDHNYAKLFLYKKVAKQVNSPLDKMEDKLKAAFRADPNKNAVMLSQNYRVECKVGNPRELFDIEKFIGLIAGEYPNIELHVLRALVLKSKSPSTAPVSIEVEYIGDTNAGKF